MPYPTVAHTDAIAWVARWREQEDPSVPPPAPPVTIKPEGDARDWDNIATALVAELDTLFRDYVQAGGRDVAMAYEADASVLVHERLPEHPALGDPEFWTWLAVVHGPELVVQRYAINRKSGSPKVPGTNNFSSRGSPENLFFRLWFRGEIGYCEELRDPYFYARCGDIDVWRSHLFRQGYADARPFAHALLSFQYPEGPGGTPRLGISAIRTLVKRLRRARTNIFFEFMDKARSVEFIESEYQKMQFQESA
jgi:Family of unknown function (DUF6339)